MPVAVLLAVDYVADGPWFAFSFLVAPGHHLRWRFLHAAADRDVLPDHAFHSAFAAGLDVADMRNLDHGRPVSSDGMRYDRCAPILWGILGTLPADDMAFFIPRARFLPPLSLCKTGPTASKNSCAQSHAARGRLLHPPPSNGIATWC